MSEYKTIRGTTVEVVASNPANLYAGKIWYNSTDSQLKIYKDVVQAWATGGNLNLDRSQIAGAGASETSSLVFGGTRGSAMSPTMFNNTESYNGSSWTEVNDLTSYFKGQASAGTQTAALGFGGYQFPVPQVVFGQSASITGRTQSWSGSNWTEVNDMNNARGYLGGTGTQTSALAFGGNNGFTESWNGTNWTEVNDMSGSRLGTTGAGTQTSALAIGQLNSGTLVESWNGTNWTEVSDLNLGRSVAGATGADNTSAVYFGGFGPGFPAVVYANTETWNGSSWTEVADMSTARAALAGAGQTTGALASGGQIGSAFDTPRSAATEEFTGGASVLGVASS
jgi:hypothetical protein